MLVQYIAPDRCRLNRAKQYLRRLGIVGLQAQVQNLAHGGIAQQVVRHLEGDFHRDLGGALVAFGRIVVFMAIRFLPGDRTVGQPTDPFGAVGGGTADVAYPVGSVDIADRPLDRFVPDVLGLTLVEPSHCYVFKNKIDIWNLRPVRSAKTDDVTRRRHFHPGKSAGGDIPATGPGNPRAKPMRCPMRVSAASLDDCAPVWATPTAVVRLPRTAPFARRSASRKNSRARSAPI